MDGWMEGWRSRERKEQMVSLLVLGQGRGREARVHTGCDVLYLLELKSVSTIWNDNATPSYHF